MRKIILETTDMLFSSFEWYREICGGWWYLVFTKEGNSCATSWFRSGVEIEADKIVIIKKVEYSA